MVSLLNGLSGLGAGLVSGFKPAVDEQMRLAMGGSAASAQNAALARVLGVPLINGVTAAPAADVAPAVDTAAADATPAAAVPEGHTAAADAPPAPAAGGPRVAAAASPPVDLASIKPDLTTISAPGGARFTVARSAADQFAGLVNDLEANGYTLDPKTSGGYNPRYIAGTKTPSQHAYGLAVDVNWARNPQGGEGGDIPADLARSLAAKYGLTWGGDWHGKTRDPMHFEAKAG